MSYCYFATHDVRSQEEVIKGPAVPSIATQRPTYLTINLHDLLSNNLQISMSSASEQHQHHVAGGLKAALHNPNVSEEAKANAQQRLENMGSATETEAPSYDEETNRVLGGYKATLTNNQTSSAAKAHAREVLEAAGIEVDLGHTSDEHQTRVLAGYKAALNNPRVSAEAKAHAREFLREHGNDESV
ncbi:uncharacterized protein C8R40DRAFT_1263952 [Lentinula edodes]|nr:uncharacterized protein C8R40DRAFT_1263952 [Lentinula edodes]KAH7877636.1 hypothetical protein C8R40DRAFT_1263952 [Lentinula edodes]